VPADVQRLPKLSAFVGCRFVAIYKDHYLAAEVAQIGLPIKLIFQNQLYGLRIAPHGSGLLGCCHSNCPDHNQIGAGSGNPNRRDCEQTKESGSGQRRRGFH
jgi:hypothetical protein